MYSSQTGEILEVFNEYESLIAWGYEDIKTFNTYKITHTIPLIFKEVQNFLLTKIILPIRHST